MKRLVALAILFMMGFFVACGGGGGSGAPEGNVLEDVFVKFDVSSSGMTSFVDNSTSEAVNVFLEDVEGAPLSGIEVEFWDGDGFEAFIAWSPDYLPMLDIYPHNSSHWLTMTLFGETAQAIEVLADSEKDSAISNFLISPDIGMEYIGRLTEEELKDMNDTAIIIVKVFCPEPHLLSALIFTSKVLEVGEVINDVFGAKPRAYDLYQITAFGSLLKTPFFYVEAVLEEDPFPIIDPAVDYDGDGYGEDIDCDDLYADTYPGAPELCDGMDNDCDGIVDEGCPSEVVELVNDDNSVESSTTWQGTCSGESLVGSVPDGSFGFSTYLTPTHYPFNVSTVSVNFAKANSSGYGFYLHIKDDEGNELLPTPMLIPHSEFTGYGWWEKDLSEFGIVVSKGTVHVYVFESYMASLDCSIVEHHISGWAINMDSSSSGKSTQIGVSRTTTLGKELMIRVSGY